MNRRKNPSLFTDSTDWTENTDLSTDSTYWTKKKEYVFIHRLHRFDKNKNTGLSSDYTDGTSKEKPCLYTDWTKERILIYPQIPQIGQKGEYWFIHRLEKNVPAWATKK